MAPCVIFDLDGTLADTSGDLIAAANAVFAQMGRQVRLDPARDAGTALKGGRAMLTLGLEREGAFCRDVVDRWYAPLLEAYAGALDIHTTLFPGALEAVERLRSDGYAVGICTNKPEALAEALMRSLGVRDRFGALIGADTLPVRKPDPAPFWAAVDRAGGDRRRALLVGDTVTDRDTARAAGAPCILVDFGPGEEDVSGLAPEGLIAHFDALAGEVARLIGQGRQIAK